MRWRGGGRGTRGVQPGQVARLLEPCMMALLRERPLHGYDLIEGMADFGLQPQLIDSGLVYRTLRRMEEDGWVVSSWQTTSSGPPRRVYKLTEAGEQALLAWATELRRTQDTLQRLLETVDGC